IGRRARPDINQYVPDGPAQATYELHFAIWRTLIVHAAQGPLPSGERYAVLRVVSFKPACRKLLNAKGAREGSTAVAYGLQVNYVDAIKRRGLKLHWLTPRRPAPRSEN